MTVDKVKQHSGAIGLGKCEHFIRNRPLKLHLLDKLGWCADRATVIDSRVALLTSNIRTATGMDEISYDAREPRPERLISVRLPLHGDKPGVLRNIVRDGSVFDECARELTNPAHFGKELFARLHPRIVHFKQLSAAEAAIVRRNRTKIAAQAP